MKRFLVHHTFTPEFLAKMEPEHREVKRGLIMEAETAEEAQAKALERASHRVLLDIRETTEEEDRHSAAARAEFEEYEQIMSDAAG